MATWGDNGSARANTKEYEEGIERIFGTKEKKQRYVKPMTDEQRKKQHAFPY